MYNDFCANFFGMIPFGGGFINLIIWVVIIGAVIFLLFNIFRSDRSTEDSDVRPGQRPLEILKRRYASGELSKEEYERMKNELR
ncbi:SHOCT domain-containing protein [Flexistipes sinusarabici]|nr:SHOCT domain-containing protein [Flexistipes sinusarabici]HCW92282.1 electron transporter RnfE [Flexistipes sinusarabici]